jgi:hypothetical protein
MDEIQLKVDDYHFVSDEDTANMLENAMNEQAFIRLYT